MTNLLRLVGARSQLQTQLNTTPVIRDLIAQAQAQGRLTRVMLRSARQAPARGFFQGFGTVVPQNIQQRRRPERQAIQLGDPFALRASQRLLRRGILQVGALNAPPGGQIGALVTGQPLTQSFATRPPNPMQSQMAPPYQQVSMGAPYTGQARIAEPYVPFKPVTSVISSPQSSPYPEESTGLSYF